jgi:ligand-binding sensor domain-containing protein
MLKKTILLVFLICQMALAQQPFNLSFTHLTREKGLSNTNIISMLQDKKGFVWMASLNGLNRFDGSNVRTYKPYNSNIKGNYINKLIEDNKGQMWLGTNEGLSYYNRQQDNFVHFEGPFKGKVYGATPYYIDNKGLVWVLIVSAAGTDLYTFDPQKREYVLVQKQVYKFLADVNQKPNLPLKTLYMTSGKGFQKLSLEGSKVVKTESFLDGKNGLLSLENVGIHFFAENDSTIWLTNSTHGLSKFNPLNRKYSSYLYFEKRKLFTLNSMVSYGQYLLISGNDGIHVFDKKSNTFQQQIIHSPFTSMSLAANWVEFIFIDQNDNMFCSLFGNGIDYTNLKKQKAENIFPIEAATKLKIPSNAVFRILKKGENILLKMQQGGTVEIDKNGTVVGEVRNSGQPIFVDDKMRYWTTQNSEDNKLLVFDKNLKQEKKITPKPLFNWFSFYGQGVDIGEGKYLISNVEGVFEYAENTNIWSSIVNETSIGKPVNAFHFDKANMQVFVSSNWWNQFHVFEKVASQWRLKYKLKFGFNVFSIRPAVKQNYIWLGTDKGLVSLNTKSLKYIILSEKNGLPDDAVGDIIEEKNGNYWLITNKGISYYKKATNSFREFTSVDGADSKDYIGNQNFKLADSILVFGGTNGVTKISSNFKQGQKSKPTIEITALTANEKPVGTPLYIGESKAVKLMPDQNSIALQFVAIDYTQTNSLQLKYRLKGVDKEWITAQNPATARYSEVKDGSYIFEIQVFDSNNMLLESKNLEITILAPFYRTSWFRVLLALILVGLAYVFYKIRSDQIRNEAKKKEEIRRIKAESEINALRSQMNPHFIFNCLNTVDSYILLNKTTEASKYLNKFSRLVRMILENSQQEFIPLRLDIETLELYLKLEQERSFPTFSYTLDIGEECFQTTFYIPSTLIQPFAENAILHGLRHKINGPGEIKIQIKKQEENICITLTDNGIGRKASEIINKDKVQNKTSLGLALTRERISKLNDLYAGSARLSIKDLAEGTQVIIELPLLTLYNLQK